MYRCLSIEVQKRDTKYEIFVVRDMLECAWAHTAHPVRLAVVLFHKGKVYPRSGHQGPEGWR